VAKHHGSTNKKLRCHLPLRVPKGTGAEGDPPPCWLRVGSQTVPVQEGVAIVFDDSFEHEAANDHSSEPRVVLVVDFWHPDFSDEEVLSTKTPKPSYSLYGILDIFESTTYLNRFLITLILLFCVILLAGKVSRICWERSDGDITLYGIWF
jgi:hypothetical protein